MKRCYKCGTSYPATSDYFNRNNAKPDGLASECKRCRLAITKRHRQERPELKREQDKRYRKKNHKRVRAREKAYHQRNREKRNQQSKSRYQRNRVFRIYYQRTYYQANRTHILLTKRLEYWSERDARKALRRHYYAMFYRDAHRAYRAARRARERNAPGTHTKEDIRQLYTKQEGRCAYCGADLSTGFHADHVVPLFRAGSNDITNIALTCATCNLSKGSKLLSEWLDV